MNYHKMNVLHTARYQSESLFVMNVVNHVLKWTARRSNQSILKEISPGCSLEGLMLKLKNSSTLATSCEELTHWKRP